jgi:hypothetical protein
VPIVYSQAPSVASSVTYDSSMNVGPPVSPRVVYSGMRAFSCVRVSRVLFVRCVVLVLFVVNLSFFVILGLAQSERGSQCERARACVCCA